MKYAPLFKKWHTFQSLVPKPTTFLESGKGLGSSITWMTSGRHALGGANTQLRRSSLKDTSCVWRVWPRDYRRSWFSSSSIQHSTIICSWAPPPYIARFTGLPGDRSEGRWNISCLKLKFIHSFIASTLCLPSMMNDPKPSALSCQCELKNNKQGRFGNKASSLNPSTRPSASPATL